MEKKVTFFHPYFVYGGVEKTNLRLAKIFIEYGYKVDFLSLEFGDYLKDEIQQLGIRKVELKARRSTGAISEIRVYVKREKENYDLTFISCQGYANVISLYALRKIKGFNLIVSERLHPVEYQYKKNHIKNSLIMLGMKRLYRYADVVVANSKETAEAINEITGIDTVYIYNPTLSDNYQNLAKETIECGFDESIPTVIACGRLEFEKGFDFLIQAFSRVCSRIQARMIILGEGSQRELLEMEAEKLGIKDHILLPGYVSNPYPYIAKSNAFILSSRFEGLPNVLIEAMALGIPCIATRCPSGPREILLDGRCGRLVEVDNIDMMAEAIIESLINKEDTAAMSRIGLENLYRFTPEAVGTQYVQLIEKITKEKR